MIEEINKIRKILRKSESLLMNLEDAGEATVKYRGDLIVELSDITVEQAHLLSQMARNL